MTPLQDGLQLYGDFYMKVYEHAPDGTKQLKFRFAKKNQITNDGRLVVLRLLSQVAGGEVEQEYPEYGQIWSLSVGDSSLPPAATQTGLISPVWTGQLTIPAERIYNEGLFQLNIHKEVPAGSPADGRTFAEAGLFTRGSQDDNLAPVAYPSWELIPGRKMYSRQIFPSFVKGPTMSVVFDWTLGMTIVA